MRTVLRPAIVLFLLMTVLTGAVYPLLVTGIVKVAFPQQAAGSLIFPDSHGVVRGANGPAKDEPVEGAVVTGDEGERRAIGSKLIGQSFSDPKYFWSRPSATTPMPNNGIASGGSNLGPLNPALIDAVKARVAALQAADPDNKAAIPVDLVTASASGLDPDISLAAAEYQVSRVARVRGLRREQVEALVQTRSERPLFGFLGEPRVNLLDLNLALDGQLQR